MEARSHWYLFSPLSLLKLPSRHFMRLIVVVVIYSQATGCISRLELGYSDAEDRQLTDQIKAMVTIVDEDVELLALSPEIKALLEARINKSWRPQKKLKNLRDLLYGADERNIRYSADTTKTATDTFNSASGNCLSMTSLFIGAARHMGLDAHFKVVEVKPTWDHKGQTMIRYEHIVAAGQLSPGEHYIVDFLPNFIIDERDATQVTDHRVLAFFYNNLGAENVVEGNYQEAVSYLARALQIYPDFSDAWNNMGAALRRSGKDDIAEFSFRKSISLDQYNYSALSNLARYYKQKGKPHKADTFLKRVNNYRARNPYFHYYLSQLYFKGGDLAQSQQFLQASIRLKKDEPDFYLAMAEINGALGEDKSREKNLLLARKYQEEQRQLPPRTMGHRIWYKIERK